LPVSALNRTIAELDRELEQRAAETAPALLELPGCGAITAAKLLAEIRPVERFQNDGQLALGAMLAHPSAFSLARWLLVFGLLGNEGDSP
jgi:transposase